MMTTKTHIRKKKLFPKKMVSFIIPCISNFTDKSYAVFNGVWYEIPKGTTIDEVRKYWIPDTSYDKREKGKNQIWHKKSSKGNKKYKVKLSDGKYSCECKGFQFNRNCRHIEEIKLSRTKNIVT